MMILANPAVDSVIYEFVDDLLLRGMRTEPPSVQQRMARSQQYVPLDTLLEPSTHSGQS